ncbi:MAG: hypothetical protein GQ549_01440 [Gammaproteobacteria bacterium]|nr:hypothetical protein [Gammaproteobacteria bacterium]
MKKINICTLVKNLNTGFASVILLSVASTSFAATETSAVSNAATETAYVDSVKNWGAWDLDIQPAAGGIKAPSTRPLSARGTKLRLRTNSFTALAPVNSHGSPAGNSPTPTPPPAVTPPPPVVPSPIGGPTSGLF